MKIEMEIHQNQNKFSVKEFWQGFYAGFAIIIISGFGDKLFFLNMVYSSINSFCNSFWVALAISEIMNLMNISLGQLLKKLISISTLEYIAIIIFIILGIWLIIKGIKMEERKLIQNYEDERKLLVNNQKKNINIENKNENEDNNNENYRLIEIKDMERHYNQEEIGIFDSWWKYFLIYFFSSVGDKSQIASILISTKYNFSSILNGTSIGILLLVFVAMILGNSISKLLTNKQISTICGIFFLMYALVYFIDKKIAKNLNLLNN